MLLLDEPLTTVINHTTHTSASDGGLDWSTVVGVGVAVLALVVALRTASQAKQVEIRSRRFERLCIQPIESSFKALDELFERKGGQFAALSRQQLTDLVTEVSLTLTQVRVIYPHLDIRGLIDVGNEVAQ